MKDSYLFSVALLHFWIVLLGPASGSLLFSFEDQTKKKPLSSPPLSLSSLNIIVFLFILPRHSSSLWLIPSPSFDYHCMNPIILALVPTFFPHSLVPSSLLICVSDPLPLDQCHLVPTYLLHITWFTLVSPLP